MSVTGHNPKESCQSLMRDWDIWFYEGCDPAFVGAKPTYLASSEDREVALLAMYKPDDTFQGDGVHVNMRSPKLKDALDDLAREHGLVGCTRHPRHQIAFWFSRCEFNMCNSSANDPSRALIFCYP